MADMIRVRAVEGVTCPHQPPRAGCVGYELVRDKSAQADHAVPGGGRYRIMADGQEVPNSAFYRRALARGDIAEFKEPVRKNALKEIG
jgi:hypothetical protein